MTNQPDTADTTFTKFDQLGSVLAELSFEAVSLSIHTYPDGRHFYSVTLHPGTGWCAGANGDTPSTALEKAFADLVELTAQKEVEKVEAKAAELAA